MNTLYGKIVNGDIVFADSMIKVNGRDVFTTDPTPYGYKPVVYTDAPQASGYNAVQHWSDENGVITQTWEMVINDAHDVTREEKMEAQILYTAIMTDTLIEEDDA